MTRAFLVIAVAASVALAGCAQRYKITLSNGNAITTSSKPKLNQAGSAYIFKDLQGRETIISAGRVTEIAPD